MTPTASHPFSEIAALRQAADHEIRHFAFDDLYLTEDAAEKVNRAREKSVKIEVEDSEDKQADNILRIII